MTEDTYSLTETWRLAIKAEQEAYDLYTRLGARSADAATRELFRTLAAQETRHKQLLEDEYRRVFEADM
jgi:rubrerythrin